MALDIVDITASRHRVIIITDVDRDLIDKLTHAVIEALSSGRAITPHAVLLLARQYASSGRTDVADALGRALAIAVDECHMSADAAIRADWLIVFSCCAGICEDDRVRIAARLLTTDLMSQWPGLAVPAALRTVDACLNALDILVDSDVSPRVGAAAVEELERIVAPRYSPGEGLLAEADGEEPAGLADHLAAASALLTAYRATGRLPYSMLAEEMMLVARRRWWPADQHCLTDRLASSIAYSPGTTVAAALPLSVFLANCEAARIFGRMAALHGDVEYRTAAVIAPGTNYAQDAGEILSAIATSACAYNAEGALYGVALGEHLGIMA
jgi:hypothetical protein